MKKEFQQCQWDDFLRKDWEALLRLAVREDLGDEGDLTTNSLVPAQATGQAAVVARRPGIIAGLPGVETTLEAINRKLRWRAEMRDGQAIALGERVGIVSGPVRGILTAERLLLNFLGRLSGIATLTRQYVEAVAGTAARIYDTRKTTPGWRRLEKYAVRCGGAWNHRGGLFEAVLIKDNHLAWGAANAAAAKDYTAAEAVVQARRHIAQTAFGGEVSATIVEVEIDNLEQLEQVLPAAPDIVLLDNMSAEQLHEAVARRNRINPDVELEASGGVTLENVRRIAETGIERISVGALTHSAPALDLGLDWL